MPGGSLPDIESTDHAIDLLSKLATESTAPWFIAIGYHKVGLDIDLTMI